MAAVLHPVTVSKLEPAGTEAWTVSWKRDFAFIPGQVVALSTTEDGPQRLYSIATGADESELGVLFNLAPGGWLTSQLQSAQPGQKLYCSQPLGSFVGRPGPAVWICNGTGVAPFLSMIRSGQGGEKVLIQGARIRSQFYGQELITKALGPRYKRCASADSGEGLISGRLTTYLQENNWTDDRPYYLCGSAAMIVEARDLLIRAGVSFRNILSEVYF